MKRKFIVFILFCVFFITGCENKYEGYWCRYEEIGTLVILLQRDHTEENRKQLEEKISSFEDIQSYNFSSRQDYANELGENVDDLDIYDTYVLTFNSIEHIDSYMDDLDKNDGVKEVNKLNAKTNMEIYHIDKKNKYTFTDSDLASNENLISGKYKIKNGVITFTPDDKDKKTTLLYIKDGYLCKDAECKGIFAESNSTCSSK